MSLGLEHRAFLSGIEGYPNAIALMQRQFISGVYAYTQPEAPTNVVASNNDSSKVVLTWTKSTGAVEYEIYRDGGLLDTLGDVATYDDTNTDAPVITPGAAVASDGTKVAYVVLSLSGSSIANGTSYIYKIKALNALGSSGFSETDTGYRAASPLTYQWQRSAGDSDADYSNIDGAVNATYNDTECPPDAIGRYYKCILSAIDSIAQTSSADRGYRRVGYTILPEQGAVPPRTWPFPKLTADSSFQEYAPKLLRELIVMYETLFKNLYPLDEEVLTWDPDSIAAGASLVSSDVSVPEAQLGDLVEVSASASLQGLICTGYISANGAAKICLTNPTGDAVNLGELTWRVRVKKAKRA